MRDNPSKKPRIAWFSPLTPRPSLRSAIATEALLPILSKRFEIELFVDSEEWQELDRSSFAQPVHHFLRAFLRHKEKPFNLFVSHLENKEECLFAKYALALMPGLAVFHEMSLARLGSDVVIHRKREGDQSEAPVGGAVVAATESEHTQLIAKSLCREAPVTTSAEAWNADRSFDRLSMANVDNDLQFTSQKHSERVGSEGFAVIPLPIQELSAEERSEAALFRGSLNLLENSTVFGCFGETLYEERIETVFQILNGVVQRKKIAEPHLLWAVRQEAYPEAKRRLALFLEQFPFLEARVTLRCVESYRELRTCVAAWDLCLGLQYSLVREAPLSLLLGLRFGVPCVTSQFGACEHLPLDVAPQIPVGRDEVATGVLLMERLALDEAFRTAIANRGAEYAEMVHAPEAVAFDLSSLFVHFETTFRRAVAAQEERIEENRNRLIREHGLLPERGRPFGDTVRVLRGGLDLREDDQLEGQ